MSFFDRNGAGICSGGETVRPALEIESPAGELVDLTGRVFVYQITRSGELLFPRETDPAAELTTDGTRVFATVPGEVTRSLAGLAGVEHWWIELVEDGFREWNRAPLTVRSAGPIVTGAAAPDEDVVRVTDRGALRIVAQGAPGVPALLSAATDADAIEGTRTDLALTPKAGRAAMDASVSALAALTGNALDLRPRVDAVQNYTDEQTAIVRGNIRAGSQADVDRALDNTADVIVVKPNVENVATAIRNAFDRAALSGGVVRLIPGATYTFTEALADLVAQRVDFDPNNAILVRGPGMANKPILRAEAQFSTPQALPSAIFLADIPLDSKDPSRLTRVSCIPVPLSDIANWRPGVAGRLEADNLIPWANAADNERVGESFICSMVDPVLGLVYTCSPLRIPFTLNPRVARHGDAFLRIRNWRSCDAAGSPLTRNTPHLQINGFFRPDLSDFYIFDALGPGVSLQAALLARTQRMLFERLRTDANNNSYGYGVWEEGSTDSEHHGIGGTRLRHAYTTAATGADNIPFGRRGGVVSARIFGSHGVNCEHNAFDTHSDAFDVLFIGCSVTAGYRGEQGSSFAFKMRGKGCGTIGCVTTGASAVYYEVYEGGGDFKTLDHKHTTPAGYGATTAFGGISYASGRGKVQIEADVTTADHSGQLYQFTKLNVDMSGTRTDWGLAADAGSYRLFSLTNSSVVASDMDVEIIGTPAVNPIIGPYFNDASSTFLVERMRIRTGGKNYFTADFRFPTTENPAGNFATTARIGTLHCDTAPGFTLPATNAPATGATYDIDVRVNEGLGAQPCAMLVNLTTSYPQTLSMAARGEATVTAELRANSVTVATRELTISTPPSRRNQVLYLWAQSTDLSVNQKPIVVKNSTYVKLGADVTLNAGECLRLVSMNGNYWVKG